jgi:hypothetical protein
MTKPKESSTKKVHPKQQEQRERDRALYDRVTNRLLFTKDFQSRQDALINDPLATIGERFMTWVLRRSWGEYSLHAITEQGEAAFQRDFVQAYGVDKTRVSRAVSYYQARGYLEQHPKRLIPIMAPRLAVPDPKDEKARPYVQFLENWKVANAADSAVWEDARAIDKHFREVVHAQYRELQKQEKSQNASLLETIESNSETGKLATVSPFERDQKRKSKAAQNQPKTPPVDGGTHVEDPFNARDYLYETIARMQQAFPNTSFSKPPIDPRSQEHRLLVRSILNELGTEHEDTVIGYLAWVTAQFKGLTGQGKRAPGQEKGPQGLGLLVNWARDYARIAGRTRGAGGHHE